MSKTNSGTPPSGRLTPYEWQRAILASDLPSTTKFVLMALSTHINRETGFAFPSIRILMEETGLSNKAVIKHLGDAKERGWIEIGNHGYQDQRWRRQSYRPRIPGGERRTPPLDVKVVNVVPKGGERRSQGGERRTPPFDAKNALEPAPAVACSDSQALPPYINNILTREREGEIPPSTPPDSLSVFSNSPQEGETSKVGEDVEAATVESASMPMRQVLTGEDSGLGCQNQAVKIATKANGKPTTGRKRHYQGHGASQPVPVPLTLSDDEIEAAMREIGYTEAQAKIEALNFKDHHLRKGTLSHDWQAELRIWKRRGDEYAAKNGKPLERKKPPAPLIQSGPVAPINEEAKKASMEAGKAAMAEIRRMMGASP